VLVERYAWHLFLHFYGDINNKPVGDGARAYTGDADAVIDCGLLIAT